ncbi:MAG: glycosyltransferase family 9 protein [Deferribacteraceae bacterium]|jgi:ADP-heptose:LPS heptosyltransferase|nr:glycosyltransferase family 9 protein [Deferribacteraceae bacterium]
MNVNTMRAIDRYAGTPLCFVATIFSKLFCRHKKEEKPKNILFIELSEMGSAILADPAMRKAQREYDANLFFVIFKKNKPSLDLLNTIPDENIFTIRPEGIHLITDTVHFLLWTRKKRIDTVIDIELFSRFTALLTGLSGANHKVGYYRYYGEGLYRGEMLTHRITYNPHMHISKNFIAMVNSLSEDSDGKPYSKTLVDDSETVLTKAVITDDAKETMRKRIDEVAPEGWRANTPRIVLVNPNASDLLPQRRWPKEMFIEFIKLMLARYPDIIILLTGARSESPLAATICTATANERCVNFTGKGTLKEMLSLYAISEVMLTNDSGPGHFSAVTDLHSVVLFGPETPALYGSLGNTTPLFSGLSCSPCVSAANHRKTTCVDNVCLKRITPESVAVVVSGVLDRS